MYQLLEVGWGDGVGVLLCTVEPASSEQARVKSESTHYPATS
jgi:hypothetical protein